WVAALLYGSEVKGGPVCGRLPAGAASPAGGQVRGGLMAVGGEEWNRPRRHVGIRWPGGSTASSGRPLAAGGRVTIIGRAALPLRSGHMTVEALRPRPPARLVGSRPGRT